MPTSKRLERLRATSPLYAHLLDQEPEYADWLEDSAHHDVTFNTGAFLEQWKRMATLDADSRPIFDLRTLQRFRRKMSMRIAYREINELATPIESFQELTLLAEFCLRQLLDTLYARWCERLGVPTNPETGKPNRYCVLGLGKFGGRELNFCSDLDLIYFIDTDGVCVKNGRETRTTSSEWYGRFLREFSAMLSERSEHGFLYNLDLRLRPEGDSGPLVRTFNGMANYYWTAGQTWERLALIKARPVAGDKSLGLELLEELNPFRYPRFPPPNLLKEVAGVKIRTEKEVLGDTRLELDIKSGFGGIREIEFSIQALQLINGGKNPFLQSGSTLEALAQMQRYGVFDTKKAYFLHDAYLFLRLVENRLQMRQEAQCHALPESATERETLAASLGFDSFDALQKRLQPLREQVRGYYRELFKESPIEEKIQDWTLYLGGKPASPEIESKLLEWFGPNEENRDERLRNFALGNARHLVTREQVQLFLDVSDNFDTILPTLAWPLRTLERVGKFAESYGARKQFFKASANIGFFKALCLLFDRSTFLFELLCQHPGIMEELLYEAPKRQKLVEEIRSEIDHLPKGEKFLHFLWLYVKAEQVRIAMGETLFDLPPESVELNLSRLAEATVQVVLENVDPEGELCVVALGKFGGQELSFGSDLDLLILGGGDDTSRQIRKAQQFQKSMQYSEALGPIYEVDLRLRPHGKDGPLVTTLSSLRAYHTGGGGQLWERQLLTRARVLAGNEQLGREFVDTVESILFSESLTTEQIKTIWDMRLRVEKEKAKTNPPERCFKAGPGGLLDVEFLAQILYLWKGKEIPPLRTANTRNQLNQATAHEILSQETASQLLIHYNFLRRVEMHLRRTRFQGESELPSDPRRQAALAHWMGFASPDELLARLLEVMQQNRAAFQGFLREKFNFD